MNNKIKEIAYDAGMEDYPTHGVNALYGEDTIEKFAKLIMKECAEVLAQNIVDVDDIMVHEILNSHFNISILDNDSYTQSHRLELAKTLIEIKDKEIKMLKEQVSKQSSDHIWKLDQIMGNGWSL